MRYVCGALALCLIGIHSPAAENDKLSIRRLSHSQYNNTVRDLLGDETRPADRFPQEDYVNGFKNQSAAQDIPPLLAEAYDAAAAKLARTAFRTIDDAVPLLGCRPASPQDRQCASTFIRNFGAKAFRRPLTESEAERYVSLILRESRRAGRFEAGAQLAAEAILQSPKFLFLIERGPQSPSKDYEIANRLSYLLWDTMPDAVPVSKRRRRRAFYGGRSEQIDSANDRRSPRPPICRSVCRTMAAVRSRLECRT